MKCICFFFVATVNMLLAFEIHAETKTCSAISTTVLEGKAQRLSELNTVVDPLSCIVPQIPKYKADLANPQPALEALEAYLSLTAAAILLVESNFEYVTRFRAIDDIEVAETLAIGAGNRDRSVRLNSARLLASVVDNSTFCVVLDYLHAPVRLIEDDNSTSVNARANLLGVVRGAAQWIGEENQLALARTLDYTVRSIDFENTENLTKTLALIADIERRLDTNTAGRISLIAREECGTADLYKYWIPENYASLRVDMNPNPFLEPLAPAIVDLPEDVAALVRDLDNGIRAVRAASLQKLLDSHLENERALREAVEQLTETKLVSLAPAGRVNVLYFIDRVDLCGFDEEVRGVAFAAVQGIVGRIDSGAYTLGEQASTLVSSISTKLSKCGS
ncbi:hypothetical protein [Tateyamaria sp. SN3-11]|uniref:hypothetical protein n=1 Tax=Tateyamaria sp. SN3-11 TaxID=3092147 RepID=UPI0039E9721D